jgi:hypothetical protein
LRVRDCLIPYQTNRNADAGTPATSRIIVMRSQIICENYKKIIPLQIRY